MAPGTVTTRGGDGLSEARPLRALVVALIVGWILASPARGAETEPDAVAKKAADLRATRVALKRLEAELILEPARQEMRERREEFRKLRVKSRRRGARATVMNPLAAHPEIPLGPSSPLAIAANQALHPRNIATQSEVSVAANGSHVVAAWNDGSQGDPPGRIAFATSMDGGVTWRARGGLPTTDTLFTWESDPVVAVNERTGAFYLGGLATADHPPRNAIAIVRGAFSDTGLVLGPPRLARAPRDTLPDKPWIVADSLSGNVYLSYTTFFRVAPTPGARLTDQIEQQRSTDDNQTWSPPTKRSSDIEQGLVQGSRVACGPAGEVHLAWWFADSSEASAGRDYLRISSSRDRGDHFDSPVSAVAMFPNFGSGAPGFNRPYGITYPCLAVDRSAGPYRGRVYLGWTESLDYFDDPVGTGSAVVSPGGSAPVRFEVGDIVRGRRTTLDPEQVYVFDAQPGRTAIFYMDSLSDTVDVALVIGCPDGSRLSYSSPQRPGRPRFVVTTLPAGGTYHMRIVPNTLSPGGYRVRTGWAYRGSERGRDVRDVFVAGSDDGRTFAQVARVTDTPPLYDEWLPEVAVAGDGRVFAAWYDWRDSPSNGCGAVSNIYLARSESGGAGWQTLGPLSDHTSDWTRAAGNLVPNQGDYMGLAADTAAVYAVWGDARHGDPDALFARLDLGASLPPPSAPTQLAIERVHPNPATTQATVECVLLPNVPGVLEVWDIGGRRVHEQAIDAVPSGRATVVLAPREPLPLGVYVVRVRQGGTRSPGSRLAIVR